MYQRCHIYEELCPYNVLCFIETISSTDVCFRRSARRRRWTRARSKSRSQRSGATSPLRSLALLKPPCSIPGFVWTIVIRHCWRVWPCFYHLVQSSLVLLEPSWHVTAGGLGIASFNIYHYITCEGSGLALTITNLTSWLSWTLCHQHAFLKLRLIIWQPMMAKIFVW